MSGKFRQRNFNELEVGRSYLADFQGCEVKIVRKENDLFVGSNGIYYTKFGKVKSGKINSANVQTMTEKMSHLVYTDK